MAESDNRSTSNFIENSALRFIEEEEYLDDFENEEILSNKELRGSIKRGFEESIEGKGRVPDDFNTMGAKEIENLFLNDR